MTNNTKCSDNSSIEPQCKFFVLRKKRLCRMTVRPGRQYCGEHEPQPKTDDGQNDARIPCPNDSKHTCYASKLEKHLLICNARQGELPPYLIHNINAPAAVDIYPRKKLSEISKDALMKVIHKINKLYEEHIKDHITDVPEHPIHEVVLAEFQESDRTESSLRHLRQVSSLLWLVEDEGLVQDNTCYVELGAGKGHFSYYAYRAWCSGDGDEDIDGDVSKESASGVLLVERASLRHKRDNVLRAPVALRQRLRADLAHVVLAALPAVAARAALLGLAKHLCGVATDYALRCLTAEDVVQKTRGAVMATCCHHRCERNLYVATTHLQSLGLDGEDFNIMLGVVSWATCGDGRSRDTRKQTLSQLHTADDQQRGESLPLDQDNKASLDIEYREEVGRRAKHLLDWGRVLYLREKGFEARLCRYVPASVSLENICIVAKKTCS